jgi:2'-5' RNA ligase
MALSVCLLPDARADRALRHLWQRLEADGIRTLLTHTHGRHVPHLTLATLRGYDEDRVRTALGGLPDRAVATVTFDGLGMFRRSRCWLLPAVTADLLERQQAAVAAVVAAGADLHRNYRPGSWMPHLTLAPRLHLEDLATVARVVFEVLPLPVSFPRAALVDTSTGRVTVLPSLL